MSDWLQIDEDGEIDVEEIMRQIRAHIARRRLMGDEEDWGPAPRFQRHFSQTLYDELFEAIRESDKTYATLHITQSSLPIVGRIVDVLRRKVHELVVFYVNQKATRQTAFNNHIARAFSALVEELESNGVTRVEIEVLRERVEALKARLDALEAT